MLNHNLIIKLMAKSKQKINYKSKLYKICRVMLIKKQLPKLPFDTILKVDMIQIYLFYFT